MRRADQLKARLRSNKTQAAAFGEQLDKVLARYDARQLTSAEVVAALVELAKELRAARKRNEDLGLNQEEAAFYDALAGHSDDWTADPVLADIAATLVRSIKDDLSVDWVERTDREAAIRTKIKRLLRKREYREALVKYKPSGDGGNGGGGGYDELAHRIFEQARTLYRYWPEIEGERLFES